MTITVSSPHNIEHYDYYGGSSAPQSPVVEFRLKKTVAEAVRGSCADVGVPRFLKFTLRAKAAASGHY